MGKVNNDKMNALFGGLTKNPISDKSEKNDNIDSSNNVESGNDETKNDSIERNIEAKNTAKTTKKEEEGKSKTIHFCTVADIDKVEKIKAIADKEYIPIKDIVNIAFDFVIKKYEEKNGPIRIKNVKKGDASKVFEL